ncbi:carbohydrate ABC transporter permease [Micropruina sonneratiae]|uniref:carbohydrate ABC transporter permease n=1 Tax=Micropruina sonneratiae TaxID=2986940 RepID=UPI002225B94E|nr:sugar ABC transporter permease [Micropruina sp. KQZ13P-5]MCW3159114.1 sugar ABC transporter permease [Micropruina sp. KQZ13P-5]
MRNYIVFGRRSTAQLTFALGMALVVVFSLIPAVGILVISFTDIRSLPFLPVHWVGLENYRTFFSAAQLGYNTVALTNTFVFAFAVTLFQNSLALLIAVLLNQRLKGRNFARAVVFLPTILGVTVIGLIFTLIFNPAAGPAQQLWAAFGSSSAFFGDPNLAMALVIFVQVWSGIGVAVVIYLAGLQAIPQELYEVADIDGATSGQKLRNVTIPLLAPAVTANTLLCIIGSLQSYQLIYVLTGPINPATQVLSLAIFTQGFGGAQGGTVLSQGYAAAISMVQFVIVAIISLASLAYLRRRETAL